MLIQGSSYNPYLINGKDTSTGQNVGMLTKINPRVNLYRTEEHVNYPIPNSKCGYTGAPGTAGVSKHYITEFTLNNMNIAFIGAHLLAFPTDSMRCAEREAQATVLQNVIISYINKKYEIIMLGDFNDFDENTPDRNNNIPTSHVLDILKGMNTNIYTLYNAASLIPQSNRYSDWYDSNGDCKSTLNEFSMIDHVLLTSNLMDKVKNVFIYQEYAEYCGKYNSDHYPVIVDFDFS
jgi:exonuclease III